MCEQVFSLVAPDGKVLAQVKVAPAEDGWLLGKIVADYLPEEVRKVFRWHEEVANEQMFSFLDEAEGVIERLGFGWRAPGAERVERVYDLQIMNGDDVAFRLGKRPALDDASAVGSGGATIPTALETAEPPTKAL